MRLFLLLFLFCAACSRSTSLPAGRITLEEAGVSMVVPEGWKLENVRGVIYPILAAEPENGLQPNLFIDAVEDGLLEEVEDARLSRYRGTTQYQELSREGWSTDTGKEGLRIKASRSARDGLALMSWHYLIQDEGRVIVITATCARESGAEFESIFEAALRSLQSVE